MISYNHDNHLTPCFVICSFVHGRLPYGKLKPDHVLRNLLLSMPLRKVVSSFVLHMKKQGFYSAWDSSHLERVLSTWNFCLQIFSNADNAHVSKTLRKLGLEDCFERIICFETLNPNDKTSCRFDDKNDVQFGSENFDKEQENERETDYFEWGNEIRDEKNLEDI